MAQSVAQRAWVAIGQKTDGDTQVLPDDFNKFPPSQRLHFDVIAGFFALVELVGGQARFSESIIKKTGFDLESRATLSNRFRLGESSYFVGV